MSAYYNENDPYAAQWLRNLIDAGHIAPGDVDERSIIDVCADDLRGYIQCHFFAGIGIWSAALRDSGWPDDRPIWTASCPCQPFSAAGQRGGFDDERHLWPSLHWLIAQCRPAIVVGEQVASPDGLQWLDLVQDDMEGTGYAFGAADTCAAGACVDFAESEEGQATIEWIRGAVLRCPDPFLAAELRDFAAWARSEIGYGPAHIRQRLYWMGIANGDGRSAWRQAAASLGHGSPAISTSGASRQLANSKRSGRERRGTSETSERRALSAVSGLRKACAVADSHEGQRGRFADREGCERNWQATGRQQSDSEPQSSGDAVRMADAVRPGWTERRSGSGNGPSAGVRAVGELDFAAGGGRERRRHQSTHGEPLPADAIPGPASHWIICTDGKARPTQPGILPLAHGYFNRVGILRASGNAIQKAQATQYIRAVTSVLSDAL